MTYKGIDAAAFLPIAAIWGARNQITAERSDTRLPGPVNHGLSDANTVLHRRLNAGMPCKPLDLMGHQALLEPFGNAGGPQIVESCIFDPGFSACEQPVPAMIVVGALGHSINQPARPL